MAIEPNKTPVSKRSPDERRKDFKEVSLGYDNYESALKEANRCLLCKKSPCVGGCPVGIDIPGFISAIRENDIERAFGIIQDSNSLPGVCGRVCPQEEQCAASCVLGAKFEPVNIGVLERFVSDEYEKINSGSKETSPDDSKPSVGVIGAGPAGLTIAGDMARYGFPVTVYEALHAPGGVLRYGIPEFRLPNAVIDREVERLRLSGVEFLYNHIIGKTLSMDDLLRKHSAVFAAIGAGLPWFMGIPGENLNGVYSANEYLTRSNLMESYRFPLAHTPIRRGESVAVVGGGNVAMDAARTALRLGAKRVYNIYRRSREEMPARDEEIENALEEGVELLLLANPLELLGDENNDLKGVRCLRMELGEPDASGRRRPVEIPGSEFEIDIDVAVMAIGTGPNRVLLETLPELELNRWGYIETDDDGLTSINGVYAGGDIVTGSATVISAMGAARRSGKAIREVIKR